jgi:hypothetical protein
LTGTSPNEHSFELLLNEDDRLKDKSTIDETFMHQLFLTRIGSRLGRTVTWDEVTSVGFQSTLSSDDARAIFSDVRVIEDLARVSTVMSDPTFEMQHMLRPKEFERVLHVLVDPDDFEIDVVATQKTSQGREALAKLVKQNVAVTVDDNTSPTGDRISQDQRMKLVDRAPSENNITFEQYFVSFETALPTITDAEDPRNVSRVK